METNNMPSLRERLWGKTQPLRDKLATIAEKTDNFNPVSMTVKGLGKAGEVIDDALGLPGRVATGFNDAVPKGFSEQVGQATEAVTGNKAAGMVTGLAAGIASPGIGGSEFKAGKKVFQGLTDVTTKTLDKLVGRGKVSKQFISDLLNAPDVRQAEKDVMRAALDEADDVVDVASYADKVKTNLLPLNFADTANMPSQGFLYENITLPDSLRGPVAKYNERIYESPIATSAGDVHFTKEHIPNYFAHTRIEDLPSDAARQMTSVADEFGVPKPSGKGATGTTRRVIEIQSDLMQKGRLDAEVKNSQSFLDLSKERNGLRPDGTPISPEVIKKAEARIAENEKLAPYRNTWHERIIREEVKQAAVDGKTKLQFPVGKTAMQIEGLGNETRWLNPSNSEQLNPSNLTVGGEAKMVDTPGVWVITDVLGDGKFKAVPKVNYDLAKGKASVPFNSDLHKMSPDQYLERLSEEFDISGKGDESNPIYKFYEKDIGKFLQKNYGAKRVTDPQGVEWWEMDVKPEWKDKAVFAHGMSKLGTTLAAAGAGAAAVVGKAAYDNKERLKMVPDAIREVYGYEPENQSASVIEAKQEEPVPVVEEPKIDLSTTVAPKEFHAALSRGIKHLNRFVNTTDPSGRQYAEINPEEIVNLFNAENGGSWSPTNGNKKIDYGISQLNASKRKDLRDPKTVWGSSWDNNFKDEYGNFDENNPEHQILGGVIVYAYARQKLTDLFKGGELNREPTQEDFIVAYNMDAKQVADAINGEDYNILVTNNSGKKVKKSLQKQYNDYLNYIKKNATSTQQTQH